MDVEQIAKGLTKAQADALVALCDREGQRGLSAQQIAHGTGRRPSSRFRFAMDRVARGLCDKGLGHWIRSRDDQWGIRLFYPNESGKAVRAHLLVSRGRA